jgi:hypothetical protein
MDPLTWIGLFQPFTSVKMLELSIELAAFIAAVLQGLTGESATEVFFPRATKHFHFWDQI